MNYTAVVDASYLLNRVLRAGGKDEMAYKDMTNSMGIPSGGPYGVLKSLRSMLNHGSFSIDSVIFCWDGYPRLSERRVALYPAYKNPDVVAPPTEEDLKFRELYLASRQQVVDILKLFGIPSISFPRREGDDLCRLLTEQVEGQVLIISDDKAYCQMVSDKVHIYRALKDQVVTPENFVEVTNIKDPRRFLLYLAICGGHDNVTGINGVGGTTAERVANTCDRIGYTELFRACDELMKTDTRNKSRYQKVKDGVDIILRNLMLIDLKQEKFTEEEVAVARHAVRESGSYQEMPVLQAFNTYEFKSYLNEFGTWILPFRKLSPARLTE